MSFSQNEGSHRRSRGRWTRRAVLLGTALLVLGPLVVRMGPLEWSRWQAAKAYEQLLLSDHDAALRIVESGLERVPAAPELLKLRMRIRLSRQEYELALADCESLLKSAPDNLDLLGTRSTLYLHLRRHSDALADVQRLFQWIERIANANPQPGWLDRWYGSGMDERRIAMLVISHNLRAYTVAVSRWHQALSGQHDSPPDELLAALADAEIAIDLQRRSSQPEMFSLLDTRGFIYYLLGDFDSARDDLELAISEYVSLQPQLVDRIRQSNPDHRVAFHDFATHRAQMDVVQFHHQLVLQKLGSAVNVVPDGDRF